MLLLHEKLICQNIIFCAQFLIAIQHYRQQIKFLPLQVREITVNLLWLSGVQPVSRIDIVCFCCPKESMLCLNLYCFIEKEKDKTKQ